MLDESTYNALVARTFKRLLQALDTLDPDLVETDATPDMVTITASNGEKCIVNTQRAVRQIWVAGKGMGIHFDWDPAREVWADDKGKSLELFSHVADVVKHISGQLVSF